jgi:hypothetical protein
MAASACQDTEISPEATLVIRQNVNKIQDAPGNVNKETKKMS